MLNTIKSKIIFLTVSVLFVLSLILTFFAYANFKNDKNLMIKGCNFTISNFAEQINKEIIKLENNAKDLAIMGEIYFQTGKSEKISEYLVKNIFISYKNSLGGGIWFEPFMVTNKRLSCVYAYRNKNDEVLIDEDFESEKYDYLNRGWYKEIMPKLSKNSPVAWSNPYYEDEGSSTLMTTVGAGIYDNEKLVGISTVDWQISSIIKTVSKMKPTPNSFALFADKNNDYIIVSSDQHLVQVDLLGKSLKTLPWYNENLKDTETFMYHNVKYISYIKILDNGMMLIINVPEKELFSHITKHLTIMLGLLLLTSILIALGIYIELKRNINRPIDKLTKLAKEIGNGDLDVEIKLEKPKEFADLAYTFNKMTKDIKEYITNINRISSEKEKIESELSIARAIQYSALPATFYPNMDEIDIYATMDTAKEVGGDFYDFFFINPTQFMFLIADVSGKGIPAALFMMTTKTLIKNLANENYSPKELIEKINKQICENNKQGFFVTLFAGIIDIITGKMFYINCGHNPPLIRRANGKYDYLNIETNLVLGAIRNFNYKIAEDKFNKGDRIFLYTDGVTEALNANEELYGEERLLNCLNSSDVVNTIDLEELLNKVKFNLAEYIGSIEQSDDITMLVFDYHGSEVQNLEKTYTNEAKIENYDDFSMWFETSCQELKIAQADRMKLMLVSEEIFVNISNYAYPNSTGKIEITLKKNGNEIILKFADWGIKYNPLEKPDPNINLSLSERPIGGLGIYMVKNSVDEIYYEYIENKNVLTMKLISK